jgi:murein DD-endopeptidase MepM/ murein hydrolase activator NlpD
VTRLVALDDSVPGGESVRDLLVRIDVYSSSPQLSLSPEGATISLDKGFDKCAAASAGQMQGWKSSSPYRDANIYFGGSARACSQPNLGSSWVSTVFSQGWRLIPTWVGPQAPCSSIGNRFSSDPATARNQGLAEAGAAVDAASALGLGAGTPLYYDLEAYDPTGACSAAVRAFVNAWVERVRSRGYVAGVYSLARNAQADWAPGVVTNVPDAVWIASWACTGGSSCNWSPSVFGISGLSDSHWANNQRIRQYWGDHNETWGGVSFAIDSNYANGPVAVAASEPPPSCQSEVPADRWRGEYFPNRTLSGSPSMVRDDGASGLAFDWGSGGPNACGVGADNFSARWTRSVDLPAGQYRFTVTTDDGVRLYVDDVLRIDKWLDRAGTTDSVELALGAGRHAVRMEYYDNAGLAVARLSWERIGDPPPPPSGPIIVDDGNDDGSGVLELLVTATGRPEWWHHETGMGYGNDMVWTTNTAGRKDNYARWRPNLPGAGAYRVEAYIPSNHATTGRASYVILAAGASTTKQVNQDAVSNAWVDLGTYTFRDDGTEYVELADPTGEASNSKEIGFDAMRFTPIATPPPSCQATVAGDHWKGEYFSNRELGGAPAATRDDGTASLDFDWGAGSPAADCGVPADQFSVRWTRTVTFAAGSHRFTLTSDDGFRLFVDDTLRLDKWLDQAPTTYTVDVPLAAGAHDVRLEYYENGGGAVARLSWSLIAGASIVIDDGDAGFQLFGPSQWWHHETGVGHGGDMVWTTNVTNSKENYARWTPQLPAAGRYQVEAYIPSSHATTSQAKYVIVAGGGSNTTSVDQSAMPNRWVDLGTYDFRSDGTEYVELADPTGEAANSRHVGFDALRFTPGSAPPPPPSGGWAFPVGTQDSGAGWQVTLGLGQSWTSSSGQPYNGHLAEDWSKVGGGSLGQPVYAAAAGEVVTVVQNCGNYVDVVVLRHDEQVGGEAIYTMYGHIETTLRAGDRVTRRQQLGTIGDPVTFGPHLHFEVKNRTALVNPPLSNCSDTARGIYVSAGYSGRRNDYAGGESWDPTDSVAGNLYFPPTRFIQGRLPSAAVRSRLDAVEPAGPPAFPSASDGLARCEVEP